MIAGAEVISQHYRVADIFADIVPRQDILRVDVFRDAPTRAEIPDILEIILITDDGQFKRVVTPTAIQRTVEKESAPKLGLSAYVKRDERFLYIANDITEIRITQLLRQP